LKRILVVLLLKLLVRVSFTSWLARRDKIKRDIIRRFSKHLRREEEEYRATIQSFRHTAERNEEKSFILDTLI